MCLKFLLILFWDGGNVGQMKSLESEPNLTEESDEMARQKYGEAWETMAQLLPFSFSIP